MGLKGPVGASPYGKNKKPGNYAPKWPVSVNHRTFFIQINVNF